MAPVHRWRSCLVMHDLVTGRVVIGFFPVWIPVSSELLVEHLENYIFSYWS